jgi:hydrogenase maturation protein HypF
LTAGIAGFCQIFNHMPNDLLVSIHVHISGIVQGVGFRPFVYNLARLHELTGWVKNTSAGVDIEAEGLADNVDLFIEQLQTKAPPLSSIEEFVVTQKSKSGLSNFSIHASEAIPTEFQPISPDIAICSDCLRELFDPKDNRYRYPFINCTNCGPRFSIIKNIPYDRPLTSMSTFEMCPSCANEYADPANRRFHAQPIACPTCGPRVWLEEFGQTNHDTNLFISAKLNDAINKSRNLLLDGKIVAIKGLGGFHLACNAHDSVAVSGLRMRKLRVDKPFGVMMRDMQTVEKYCNVDEQEKALLSSPAHPIVILNWKKSANFNELIAPGQNVIGVMLPYTPLHALLLENEEGYTDTLVMTSGNLSDEPICTENDDARIRLKSLADAFLMHDREIHIRTDDSVMRVQLKDNFPIRRSRGYSPYPVKLTRFVLPLLAAGAELKNTFCLTKNNYAFLSHHIGDLENHETLLSYENGITHFEKLFRVKPEAIVYDLHPNYLSTRYAINRSLAEGIKSIGIQHHHAHIASLMAEYGLDESRTVIGVAFDGTGYGDDGTIWGGEFLIANYAGYQRAAHLQYFPLPGGDAATRRPSRTALGLLYELGLDWDRAQVINSDLSVIEQNMILKQLNGNVNTPMTSSMGRFFDAVASLIGIRQRVNYEGQAAIELEAITDPGEKGYYDFEYSKGEIRTRKGVKAILSDKLAGVPNSNISGKFHNGVARVIAEVCFDLSNKYNISEIALSGGVWQNSTLLQKTIFLLEKEGFTVFRHHKVPTNDGGLALGQAAIGAFRFK